MLGRASNLPTVWSNVLAAWLLAGGTVGPRLGLAMLGATLAYIGGMYLNDAFDAEFDREFRRERPIPSGAVSEQLVWRAGGAMLAAGTLILATGGWLSAVLSAGLAVSVVLYDWIHKRVTFSPVLMAACRFFLFLAVVIHHVDRAAYYAEKSLELAWLRHMDEVARAAEAKKRAAEQPAAK